jgi:hypothetical protein
VDKEEVRTNDEVPASNIGAEDMNSIVIPWILFHIIPRTKIYGLALDASMGFFH